MPIIKLGKHRKGHTEKNGPNVPHESPHKLYTSFAFLYGVKSTLHVSCQLNSDATHPVEWGSCIIYGHHANLTHTLVQPRTRNVSGWHNALSRYSPAPSSPVYVLLHQLIFQNAATYFWHIPLHARCSTISLAPLFTSQSSLCACYSNWFFTDRPNLAVNKL